MVVEMVILVNGILMISRVNVVITPLRWSLVLNFTTATRIEGDGGCTVTTLGTKYHDELIYVRTDKGDGSRVTYLA